MIDAVAERRNLRWDAETHRWTRRDVLTAATAMVAAPIPASVPPPVEGSAASIARQLDPVSWDPIGHRYRNVSAAPFDAGDFGMDPAATAATNAQALNAAMLAASQVLGSVHIPAGSYLSNPLTAQSGVMVYGEGEDITAITLAPGQSGAPSLLSGVSGLNHVLLRNMTLDGGSVTYAETDRNHVLYLPDVANFSMWNVAIRHGRHEGYAISGQDIDIFWCDIEEMGQHGGWINTGTGVTTDRVTICDNTVLDWGQNPNAGGAYGLVCQASAANTATGDNISLCRNHVEMVTASAGAGSCIYVAGGQSNTDGHTYLSRHLKIEGNRCLNAGLGNSGYTGAAIEIALNCPDFSCQWNTVDGSVYDGISYGSGTGHGANDATVTGGIIGNNIVTNCLGAAAIEVEGTGLLIVANLCHGNAGHGIYVAGVNSATSTFIAGTGGHAVLSNTCWLNGNNGVCFVNCPNVVIVGNTCYNNGTSAAGFAGIKFQTNSADFEVTGGYIAGNNCFDTRSGGSRTQSYGIDLSASSGGSLCDGNFLGVNDCHNNTTNDILLCQSPTTPDVLAPRGRKQNMAFSVNPAFDPASYDQFAMTLTGSINSPTILMGGDGETILIALTQDATGGRTVVWPASFAWPGGTAPTLSGAGKTDIFQLQYDFTSGKWRQISASQNL